eukprot:1548998-Pyramimonas_sp.AAC.1
MAMLVGYRGDVPLHGYAGWIQGRYTFAWLCWLDTRGMYLRMAMLVGYTGNVPSYGYAGWIQGEYAFVWLCWLATG